MLVQITSKPDELKSPVPRHCRECGGHGYVQGFEMVRRDWGTDDGSPCEVTCPDCAGTGFVCPECLRHPCEC